MKFKSTLFLLLALCTSRCVSPDSNPTASPVFFDPLNSNDGLWTSELEKPGKVTFNRGLYIDAPAGATVWFKPALTGPVMIEYKATAISAGGPNDRVSDLNCFWMATDSRNPKDFFAVPRSGKFADYNQLLCYYVGLGGNNNTTTRFRRYIGSATTRPIRPQDDLREASTLLIPNHQEQIKIIDNAKTIEFWRDDRRLFQMIDDQPYTSGHFGFRTTTSHLRIRDFKITFSNGGCFEGGFPLTQPSAPPSSRP